MNASKSTLSLYQQLVALSNECMSLAQKAEWDKLIEFAQRYVTHVEMVAQSSGDKNLALSTEDQQRIKIHLLHILNNEKGIKILLQNRMVELKGLMQVSTQQQSLNAAYQKFSDRRSYLPGDIDTDDK